VEAGASDVAKVTTMISAPHLWNGLVDPYLYRVQVELREQGAVRDAVTQPLGFRAFAVDPANGFSLNGTYLDLHGVNRHQDRQNKGWAISPSDQDEDMAVIRELGANAVRLVHYQHGQYFLDLCDRYGMAVWTELAMVNQITNSAAFTANARQQLTELIRQNFNHPSIFFWGIENEVLDNMTDPNPLITELSALAHTEDPSRVTTVAANLGDANAINWHTDLVGFNKYYGWYYGVIGDIGAWADGIHAAYPTRRIGISEFGAGAGLKNHTLPPTPATDPQAGHSEEYQALFHEGAWKAMQTRRFLWGKFVWQLFDSAADGRDETAKGADVRAINDKGLVAFDHSTRKDAFYWYKANWSTAPFVYITSRRFTQRTAAATAIKVYSTLPSVEAKLNGVSLGSKTSTDHIFIWDKVTLATGTNHVEVTAASGATKYSDTVDWSL
jgi:beta-galactosidase